MQNLSDRILKRRDISYGLYVYHMPIANFIIYTAGTGMSNAMLAFALTVAVSILSYANHYFFKSTGNPLFSDADYIDDEEDDD